MAMVLVHWDTKSDVRIDLQPECTPGGVCTYLDTFQHQGPSKDGRARLHFL